jgi:hypothetical protein
MTFPAYGKPRNPGRAAVPPYREPQDAGKTAFPPYGEPGGRYPSSRAVWQNPRNADTMPRVRSGPHLYTWPRT